MCQSASHTEAIITTHLCLEYDILILVMLDSVLGYQGKQLNTMRDRHFSKLGYRDTGKGKRMGIAKPKAPFKRYSSHTHTNVHVCTHPHTHKQHEGMHAGTHIHTHTHTHTRTHAQSGVFSFRGLPTIMGLLAKAWVSMTKR